MVGNGNPTLDRLMKKLSLFDRNGRKDKKKRLNDLHETGSMLEDKLFEKAEKAKKKATKYENSKYDSVNSRYDKKAAKRAGKDAWKKALDDKKLNRDRKSVV